mmetsp:Transcript_64011/g.206209  ORF Transcript_64011/g.206209 Transcript_64011/m.206209 type:complete len:214 (+) Transcript_64011:510-1151(+)
MSEYFHRLLFDLVLLRLPCVVAVELSCRWSALAEPLVLPNAHASADATGRVRGHFAATALSVHGFALAPLPKLLNLRDVLDLLRHDVVLLLFGGRSLGGSRGPVISSRMLGFFGLQDLACSLSFVDCLDSQSLSLVGLHCGFSRCLFRLLRSFFCFIRLWLRFLGPFCRCSHLGGCLLRVAFHSATRCFALAVQLRLDDAGTSSLAFSSACPL